MKNKEKICNLIYDKTKFLFIGKCFAALFIFAGFYMRYLSGNWISLIRGSKSDLSMKLFDVLCGCCLLLLLVFTVYDIKIEDILQGEAPVGICWLYGLVLSAQPVLGINFLDKRYINIEKFHRVIGNATLEDYDIAKVIRNFTLWFIYFGLILLLFSVFISKAKKKYQREEQNNIWMFLDNFMVVSGVFTVLFGITYFEKNSAGRLPFQYSVCLIATVIGSSLIYLLSGADLKISRKNYKQLLMIAFLSAIPLFMILKRTARTDLFLFMLQFGFVVIGLLAVLFRKSPIVLTGKKQLFFDCAALTASRIPLCLSVYIELVNILAARGKFITNPYRYYPVYFICSAVVLFAFGAYINKRYVSADTDKIAYPLCLFGLVALSVQLPLVQIYTPDIFESANAGILISDFLNFGKIPLVEHYGGHMMTDVWEGIIYGILNEDIWGAAFSPYSVYRTPVCAVLLYFIFKILWDKEMAFWSILLIPVTGSVSYFAFGLSTVLAMVVFIKKATYTNSFIMWFVCIMVAIYRLDLGYSFILAGLATLFVYICKEKQLCILKTTFLPLAVYVVLGCGLWAVLCLHAGENPVYRLVEFLKISSSNQNWAYSSLGDTSKSAFALSYLILPLTAMATLCYSVLFDKLKTRAGIERRTVIIMLGFAYFTNFSRGLVRHSYAENTTTIVVWCALLYLAAFCSGVIGKKMLLPTFVALIIVNHGTLHKDIFVQTTIADDVINKVEQTNTEWQSDDWKDMISSDKTIARVQVDEGTKNMFYPIETIVDTLLREDETFIDFANISFAYSYLQRECPVYVSQSPLQLSGEFTQEQFVKQISENPEHTPVAIMANKPGDIRTHMDDVSNAYRYYKVSEYLYSNYVPLCSVGDYAVWCTKERYGEYSRLLSEYNIQELDYSYDCKYNIDNDIQYLNSSGSLHIYNLKHLPRIRGEFDSRTAERNEVEAKIIKGNKFYKICYDENIDRSNGNYLRMDINCVIPEDNGTIIIRAGSVEGDIFTEKARYKFMLKDGLHTYLIRISSDYNWYCDGIDSIMIESDNEITDVDMCVISGN